MTENNSSPVSKHLFTMQLIAGALLAGAMTILLVMAFLVQQNGPSISIDAANPLPIITRVALAFLIIQIVVSLFLPELIERSLLNRLFAVAPDQFVGGPREKFISGPRTDEEFLLRTYLTKMIFGLALFEGASVFGSVAYLTEGQFLAVGVSLAAILGMLLRFPTRDPVEAWLRDRKQTVAFLREQKGTSRKG